MKTILTDEQKQHLEKQHRTMRDGKVRDRIKAVLLHSEGWTQESIAQALRIHETTVWEHLKEYHHSEKLKSVSGGSLSKLSELEAKELETHLENNTYATTKEILEYVKDTYRITYTLQGMHAWLTRHEFSYKKPKGVPAKFNAEKQEAFIKKYEELKSSLGNDDIILFMDSVHPTQATKISYGWIKKGVEKMIATVASRNRVNLTGALELNSLSIITDEYDTINGSTTVKFLNKILESYPNAQTIHIIADGGRAHTSQEVDLFLLKSNAVNRLYLKEAYGIDLPSNTTKLTIKMKKNLKKVLIKDPQLFNDQSILETNDITAIELLKTLKEHPPHPKIRMHILPPYSPNLNPIERVWKIANEYVRNNVVFPSFSDFKEKIMTFYDVTWNIISGNLRGRLTDNFQTLKPVVSI
jgi:transposase